MSRAYVPYPDPALAALAAPVAQVDGEIRALWDEMLEAMYAMPGVGLAAPQLGVLRRVIVVDAGKERQPVRMANPDILEASAEMQSFEEGSPNLPGLHARVSRPRRVLVRYLGADGALAERQFEGLWATSVQHQIDHLNGKLFIDRLSPLKRRMLLKKHAKARGGG